MNINHLITIFLIVAVAAASDCLYEKPKDNKPVEITLSAAISPRNALKDAGRKSRKIK